MRMLKFETDGKSASLEVVGTIKEAAAESCRMIQLIYSRLRKQDPNAADAYKNLIQTCIADPASPMFGSDGSCPANGVDISIVTPPTKGGRS